MSHGNVTNEDLQNHLEVIRKEREEDLQRLRLERENDMKAIMDLLKPMADTYKTASTLGKWVMAAAVFISIMLGIVLSIASIYKK